MTEKPEEIGGYNPGQTERAEQVLLEIWTRLGEFRKHFVLVGGLVPRYLVPQHVSDIPNHCGTLDVDLAVSLSVANVKAYATIRERLERIGLRPGTNAKGNEQRHSFTMAAKDGPVVVDFLTTRYEGPTSVVRAVQQNLSAIQVEGMGLALVEPLAVPISGKTLTGGLVSEIVQVCRPVPFIVLKALSFENRREGKDVHDLVYIIQHSKGGAAGLAAAVREDERAQSSFQHAMESLARNFKSPSHDGPVRCARFQGGGMDCAPQAFAAIQEFLEAIRY